MNERAQEIFEFWFGQPDAWFDSSPAFDEEIRRRFKDDHDKAVASDYDAWRDDQRACLCLVLLLDQFPRNMFRGTPKAFATDSGRRRSPQTPARIAQAQGPPTRLQRSPKPAH